MRLTDPTVNKLISKPISQENSRRLKKFVEWLATAPFQLEAAKISRFHQLTDFMPQELKSNAQRRWPQIFVVQHNWGSAFSGDKEFDDKTNRCRLPAPDCCFEFMVSGRPIIGLATENTYGLTVNNVAVGDTLHVSIRLDGEQIWFSGRAMLSDVLRAYPLETAQAAINGYQKLYDLIYLNVRAACIALEAEIAETEVVRAPFKLNKARQRRGKAPMNDFNIINLAKRKRYAPVPLELQDEDKRNGVRLHFRRGHTRHYPNYNVWIKWQLVGNPDLGFIDKDYKL